MKTERIIIYGVLLFMIFGFTNSITTNNTSGKELQFENGIFITLSLSTSLSDTLIVPSGKIVKITSVGIGSGNGINIKLNGIPIVETKYSSGDYYKKFYAKYPIWLPAGTYIFSSSGWDVFISGIEFNIVQ